LSYFRKSLFWVIALVVLGGGFYLIDERVEEAGRIKEASLRLFPFDGAEVTAFWIARHGEGFRARGVRAKDGWWLAEPLRAKGDDEAIGALLRNITGSPKDAVLFENPTPAKLRELGLDTPGLELGLVAGDRSMVVRFGNKGPTHNVTYAMFEGEPKVYRVHSDVRKQADLDVHALRDKTVLSFDPPSLKRLELKRLGKDTVVVVHDRGRWDMAEPEPAHAAMAAVLETLYMLKDSQVKAFIEEAPADLAPYGLDSPRITVSILETGQEGAWTLSIGAKDRTRRGYFARTGRTENVILLEESVVNGLLADADRWRAPDGGA
jgi:hypothetical protein